MPPVVKTLLKLSQGWLHRDITIALFCAVIIALLWSLTLERIHYERIQTTTDHISNNDNLALAFDEHTALSLKNVDRVLLLLIHEYANNGLNLNIQNLIKAGLIDDTGFNFIGVVDAQGKGVLGRDLSLPADVPDREYFKVHQQQDNYGMFIGKPLLGRVTGRLSIHMSRRINKPDGSFGGVVFIAVDPKYFTTFYAKARLGEGGMITLVGLDGMTRARQTDAISTSGQDMNQSTLIAESRKSKNGNFRSIGKLEGVVRFFSYRTLREYPMVVAVATSEATILQEFHRRERNYYLIAIAGTAIILIFTIGLVLVLARQKRAEFLLAGSEQRFRSMIENASDLLLVFDRLGRIEFVSPSVKQIFGYEIHEVEGRSFLHFIHPEDSSAGLARLKELIRNPAVLVKSELRFLHKNGDWVTLDAIARNALENPLLKGIVITARDITQRKRAEQELEFRNIILATQQEGSLDAILVVDSDRRIISYNSRFVELWHVPRELIDSRDNQRVLQSIIDQAENPEEYLARVLYLYAHMQENARDDLKLKDGRIIDRYSTSMIGPDGRYYGRVWYFRDITARKQAERLLQLEHKVASTFADAESGSSALKSVIRSICEALNWECGRFLKVDEEAGVLRMSEFWHVPDDAIEQFVATKSQVTPGPGIGLAGRTWQTGQATWITDIKDDPHARWAAGTFEAGLRGAFHFPVMSEGKTIGVLAFNSRNVHAPNDQILDAAHTIGSQIGQFVRRMEQRESIARLNHIYAVLSGGNSAIVRATSRLELSQRICEVATTQGGWAGTWIGFVDKATQRIVPEAWSESMTPYIAKMAVSVDPAGPGGSGPTGNAVRSGTPYFCNDLETGDATLPRRQFIMDFGIASVASIPLRLGKDFVGVVNFYATQKDFYTRDVQALLLELGGDISFALDMFEREARRQQAEHELAENEEKFRGLIEQTIAGIYIIQNDRFAYINPRFAEILGYDVTELTGKEFLQVVNEPDRDLVRENIHKRLSGIEKSLQYTFKVRRKNGSLIDIGVHGSRAMFQGKPAVIGMMQDITERKKIEEQEKHYMERLELSMVGTVNAVSAMVELRDPYTSGHERRVAEIAAAIGTEMELPEEQINGLRIIGNVHDIGKIAAPAEILSKPGRLSAIEFEIIKTHAQQGYDILKGIDFPWPVAQTILQHHERMDGSGYPQGLKGDQILLEARILAVADTVEAMSSHRPYRAGLGIDAALKEIEDQSGKRYCPQAAAACLRLFREKNYQIPV